MLKITTVVELILPCA